MSEQTWEPSDRQDNGVSAACARVAPLLPVLTQDRLEVTTEREVLEHLVACVACAERFDTIQADVLRLVQAAPVPTPRSGLRDNLFARIAASDRDARLTQRGLRANRDTSVGVKDTMPYEDRATRSRSIPDRVSHWGGIWSSTAATALIVALLTSVLMFAAHGRFTGGGDRTGAPPAAICAPGSITVALPAHAQLTKVAMVSPTDGWAIGSIPINGGVSFQPFLERFQHCHWSPAPALPISNAVLNDIAMPSASDGWVAGYTIGGTLSHYVLLHYSGGRWASVTLAGPIPRQGASADAISYVRMLSADEGWLVAYWGSTEANTSFHLYHYVHGTWSYVAGPLGGIGDVAPVGPDEAWMVGTQSIFGGQELLAHYAGGRWSTQSVPLASSSGSFSMDSPRNIILTGLSETATHIISMHYDGTGWRMIETGLPPDADGVQYFAGTEGWAFSISNVRRGNSSQPLPTPAEHLANGEWSVVTWPFPNDAIVPPLARVGAGDFWAIGIDAVGPAKASWTPVFFQFTGGKWYVYGQPE